jgi:tRNA pseudouridine55 synthase
MAIRSDHGLLVLDKPGGMTSRDAVNRAQRWFPRGTRIGHTGTLDPLATGVLVLCVGQATRLGEYIQRMAKTYETGIRLGVRSDTDDADGTVIQQSVKTPPGDQDIRVALEALVGVQNQVPPLYSAAKLSGQRAYALARAGQAVALEGRTVEVYGIDVLRCAYPRVDLRVCCGKGTYIRSLARDLGETLGCGGLVESLRRMRVGIFDLSLAVDLNAGAEEARNRMLPTELAVKDVARCELTPQDLERIRCGRAVELPVPPTASELAVFGSDGRLAALAVWDAPQGLLRPTKVLARHGL